VADEATIAALAAIVRDAAGISADDGRRMRVRRGRTGRAFGAPPA
jgi:hypothetical protein